jgi:hypothetical protein
LAPLGSCLGVLMVMFLEVKLEGYTTLWDILESFYVLIYVHLARQILFLAPS